MKFLTPLSSGKFEFMTGKCQGILFCPMCGNPEKVLIAGKFSVTFDADFGQLG